MQLFACTAAPADPTELVPPQPVDDTTKDNTTDDVTDGSSDEDEALSARMTAINKRVAELAKQAVLSGPKVIRATVTTGVRKQMEREVSNRDNDSSVYQERLITKLRYAMLVPRIS